MLSQPACNGLKFLPSWHRTAGTATSEPRTVQTQEAFKAAAGLAGLGHRCCRHPAGGL